ncbi:MAG TPA: hypothetical protein VEP90_20320, partial [Methylomirabilota bacterium]|nr:hypothetical protein [Methylomirabilota bacterium]
PGHPLQKRTKIQWDIGAALGAVASRLILSNITGFAFFRDRDGPLDLRSQDATRRLCCGRHRPADGLHNGSRLYHSVATHGTIDFRSHWLVVDILRATMGFIPTIIFFVLFQLERLFKHYL